ncbi:bi-domain-containing oxidoreductase, partial [Candidatus Babeliales bacterium]|nr:bi-domain-containing oxidoreductase [Candidatus Babeliales bacterium]
LTQTSEKINKVRGAIKENGLLATLALIKGSLNKVMALGYSCSGEVVQIGKNCTHFSVGDFVACAGAGIANHAELVAVPKNLVVKLTNEKYLKQSSLTTIGAIALQGIRRADLRLGEKVCVIGLGLIGQLTVQLAKLSGCEVFGVDIDNTKLFLAQKCGCDRVYNPRSSDFIKEILFHTGHHSIDKTIITAGSQDGTIIQQAMELTRRKGTVVLVGDVKLDFIRSPFYEKEIDFLISCSYGPGRYDASYEKGGHDYPYAYVRWTENRNMELFAKLIEQGKLQLDSLISHEFAFEDAEKAYETLQERKSLGLVLEYESTRSNLSIHPSSPSATPGTRDERRGNKPSSGCPARPEYFVKQNVSKGRDRKKQNIRTAFIGAGGFAKIKLLPLASKLKNTQIHTIIDTDAANALNVSRQYKAEAHHNDYKTILNNQDINTVIIATPHALHTEQTIECLKAGKAVFVEKPAAVTEKQLEQLETFFTENETAPPYCVDFNRSFAPFIQKIKTVLETRTSPLVIHYRMNAGYIPTDHWVQQQKHGGRIIGEACHIFELFCFLTGAKPTKISVNAIDPTEKSILSSDNMSVQISFDDGSVCSLLYTALGNNALAKERMEVFFDGKSIVMDDYKQLQGYGLPRSFNEKTKQADKGHKNLLSLFMQAVQDDGPSPIPLERIFMATRLSILINEQVKA